MTAFDRYGVKKAKKPICDLLFPRTTKSCSMAGCNREVPNPAFYSGGASPRCGVWWERGGVGIYEPIIVKLHHRYSTLRHRIGIINFIYYCALLHGSMKVLQVW